MIGRRSRSLAGGFTLVELLVAIGLLAVVSLGVFSLITGTLRFTERSRAVSVSLEDIADAEGYLNDTLKYARQVYAGLDVVIGAEVFRCRLDGDELLGIEAGRCVAAAVPVLDGTESSRVVDFDIVLFSVEPIGALYAADGLPRGHSGNETLALIEYRIERVCGTDPEDEAVGLDIDDCVLSLGPADLPTTSVVNEPGVLLVGLDDEEDPTIRFFASPSPPLLEVTLAARAGAGRSETRVLRNSNISLQVVVREF